MMEEMNEVHDFMEKFHDDVETKWGLSTDPSLGKKVKITILATGFGISSVPGMQENTTRKTRSAANSKPKRPRRTTSAVHNITTTPTERAGSVNVRASIFSAWTTSTTKR